jgi:hypothetical protein
MSALAGVGALSLALAGCAGTAAGDASSSTVKQACQPPLPTLSANHVKAGASVVVSDRGLRCPPLFAKDQTFRIVLYPPNRPGGSEDRDHPRTLASVHAGKRGRFRVTVTIPRGVAYGSAVIAVHSPDLDKRMQCPANASCRDFGAGLYIPQ